MATCTECGADLPPDTEAVCDHFQTEHGYFTESGSTNTNE